MIIIPKQYRSLKFQGLIHWSTVFNHWEKAEAHQDSWREHWEKRGFKSWREWREDYISPLKPAGLKWFLFQVTDPAKDVPLFYGVPSKTWSEFAYEGEKTRQLGEVKNFPVVTENQKISAIKENFPCGTLLIAVLNEKRIVLLEGMHRACALADWPEEKSCFEEVHLALAIWKKEIPTLGIGQKN